MAQTYTPIATQTLGSAAASVTFSSISGAYTDLIMIIDGAVTSSSLLGITAVFNSDTATNYSNTNLNGNGTTASSTRVTNGAFVTVALGSTGRGNTIINIPNYSNTTTYKNTLCRTNIASQYVRANVGLWRSTSAITSILIGLDVSDTFIAGSTFTLYGIKAA